MMSFSMIFTDPLGDLNTSRITYHPASDRPAKRANLAGRDIATSTSRCSTVISRAANAKPRKIKPGARTSRMPSTRAVASQTHHP